LLAQNDHAYNTTFYYKIPAKYFKSFVIYYFYDDMDEVFFAAALKTGV